MHVVLLAYMDKSMNGDVPGVRDQRGQRGYPASKACMTARLPKAAATANMEREKNKGKERHEGFAPRCYRGSTVVGDGHRRPAKQIPLDEGVIMVVLDWSGGQRMRRISNEHRLAASLRRRH